MRYRYDINKGLTKIKTKTNLAISGAVLGVSGILMALVMPLVANAAPSIIYDNIPSTLPGNLVSEAFEATSTSEFGGQVSFAGSVRQNPTVTVVMSSWGCQTGHWTSGDCATTPGATFSEPITLNVYNVGAGDSVGSLLTSSTQTFNIPYRPSANNTHCTAGDAGKWFSAADNTCYNGFATPISFSFTGTFPNQAIISVAYNTSDYGYHPYGRPTACSVTAAGCGYDSLNVGLNAPPTVGTDPLPNDAYINSSWSGAYCSGIPGTFRLDTVCWTGHQPAFEVTAGFGGNHHNNNTNVRITNINYQKAKTGNANSNGNTNGGNAISGDATNINTTNINLNINNL